jgi:hypothetical protein
MSKVAAEQRDAAIALAASHPTAAEQLALQIEDSWYRAQALAWVARYAPEHDVSRLAQAALQAAADCADPYQQAGAAAWVVRALEERGRRDEALTMLEVALQAVPRIARDASRSQALFLLFQAAFTTGVEVRRSLLFALAEIYDRDPHWRIARNYHDALQITAAVDPDFARRMAAGSDDARRLEREAAVGGDPRQPRAFFW